MKKHTVHLEVNVPDNIVAALGGKEKATERMQDFLSVVIKSCDHDIDRTIEMLDMMARAVKNSQAFKETL